MSLDLLSVVAVPIGLCLLVVSGYRYNAIQTDVSGKLPPNLGGPESVRYAVEPFVWNFGFNDVRRRYAGALAGFVAGCALIALGLWSTELFPVAIWSLICASVTGLHLGWRWVSYVSSTNKP